MNNRIIIPRTLWMKVLVHLHSAHQRLTGMKERAKNTVWWPRFNKDLEEFLQRCPHCRFMAKSHVKEPLCLTKPPDYPFQSVATDHFKYGGHQYLAIADRFTGWIKVFGTGSNVHFPKDQSHDVLVLNTNSKPRMATRWLNHCIWPQIAARSQVESHLYKSTYISEAIWVNTVIQIQKGAIKSAISNLSLKAKYNVSSHI